MVRMSRLLITLATIFAVLMGTGSFNLACVCAPGRAAEPCGVDLGCAAVLQEEVEPSSCCCCETPEEPTPIDANGPGRQDRAPGRCPCLYWSDVPFGTSDASTGTALVKRALEFSPVLLLEAVPAPMVHGTADNYRAGTSFPRESGTRVQAWLCVWTT